MFHNDLIGRMSLPDQGRNDCINAVDAKAFGILQSVFRLYIIQWQSTRLIPSCCRFWPYSGSKASKGWRLEKPCKHRRLQGFLLLIVPNKKQGFSCRAIVNRNITTYQPAKGADIAVRGSACLFFTDAISSYGMVKIGTPFSAKSNCRGSGYR